MKIIKNEKLIKRNGTIGNYLTLGALLVLGAGMYISIKRTDLAVYAMIALFAGFIMTQIGIYMSMRYGRTPRPDEKLDTALKGLQNEYTIYHYSTPASHMLVGPAGIWLLFPYHQRGRVVYKKNRWQMAGGGFMQWYMRVFAQEGIGRPDIEMDSEVNTIRKYLAHQMGSVELPEIKTIMVFTSDDIEIESGDTPVPMLKLKQIKDFFRQKAKDKPIGQTQLAAAKAAFPE